MCTLTLYMGEAMGGQILPVDSLAFAYCKKLCGTEVVNILDKKEDRSKDKSSGQRASENPWDYDAKRRPASPEEASGKLPPKAFHTKYQIEDQQKKAFEDMGVKYDKKGRRV